MLGINLRGLLITERLKCFQILLVLSLFLIEEVFLQICHCVYDHTFHLTYVDDITYLYLIL